MSHTPVRFRRAVGVADGTRTDFATQHPYQAGTLRVLINGILQRAELDDGWVELGGADFRMKVAPFAGDVVWTFYREEY